ncbi:MAG: AMP-binding protein [Bacteroidia bacterium]|nr:AMP-binding protein [Bacteroidia bacterium]
MEHYLKKLERTTKSFWTKDALANYKGEKFTFEDVAVHIEKFHIFFEAIGLEKGQHVALCARNTARWAISFLSINTYEAVVVPILADFTPDSINHLVDHSESVLLFTDTDMFKRLDISAMPSVKAVVSVSDFTLLYSADQTIKDAFDNIQMSFTIRFPMGYSRENVSFPDGNDKEICVINYTSGTTSAPKGVMIRYECFSAMIDYSITRVHVDENDSIVSMLPMGHIYGLAFEFLFPLCFGCTINYLGKTPSPTLLLKAMKDVRPFMVVSVPLVMEKVYKSSIKPAISHQPVRFFIHVPIVRGLIYKKIGVKLKAAFGGNVRHFIMGGAALNPEVEKCFRRIKLPYMVGYGMTEAAPLIGYEDWRKYVPGSCGKAVACCEVRIDSEDPQHIAGEILAKGTNICSGYFKNPEASANAFTEDGFLRTGDLGIMDKDGNIFIKGRSKNMILSANGQNIYPEEVEAVINSQDFVAESVVVDRASKLVALVFLDDAAIKKAGLDDEAVSDIPESVRVNSNRVLPLYSQITKVEIVAEPFEKTPKLSIKRFLYK